MERITREAIQIKLHSKDMNRKRRLLPEQGTVAAIANSEQTKGGLPSLRKSDLCLVLTILDQPSLIPSTNTAPVRLTWQEHFSGTTYITLHTAPCPHTTLACTDC